MKHIQLRDEKWPRRIIYDEAVKSGNYTEARNMVASARDYITKSANYDDMNKKRALDFWQKLNDTIEGK